MDSGNKSLLLISVGPKTALSPPPHPRSEDDFRIGAGRPASVEVRPVQPSSVKRRSSSEQQRSKVGFPIRKFSDQSLFAAPRNLSQRTTSFIASQRQGIHQIPLRHLIALIAKARCCLEVPDRQIGDKRSLARKDQFCFKRIRGSLAVKLEPTTGARRVGLSRLDPARARPHGLTPQFAPSGPRPNALPLHDVRYRKVLPAKRPKPFDNAPSEKPPGGSSPLEASPPRERNCEFHRTDQDRSASPPERVKSAAPPARLVEPDGIEPTTSCLQSTRSPN